MKFARQNWWALTTFTTIYKVTNKGYNHKLSDLQGYTRKIKKRTKETKEIRPRKTKNQEEKEQHNENCTKKIKMTEVTFELRTIEMRKKEKEPSPLKWVIKIADVFLRYRQNVRWDITTHYS